jgi:hypothetical protein
MLRARFSRPSRLGQFPTSPSPWRIQSQLLHNNRIEESIEPSIPTSTTKDKSAFKAMTSGKPPPFAYDLDIKARIWEWTKHASINLRHRADDFTAKSKSTFSQLGCWLNQITGYEEIEALKRGVAKQGMLSLIFIIS